LQGQGLRRGLGVGLRGSCRGRLLGSLGLRKIGLLAMALVRWFGWLEDLGVVCMGYLVEAGLELGEDVGHGDYCIGVIISGIRCDFWMWVFISFM
jgi:hypothetical protein